MGRLLLVQLNIKFLGSILFLYDIFHIDKEPNSKIENMLELEFYSYSDNFHSSIHVLF